jgi:diguanylate cyclase (GGDEF)-like protein
VLHAVPPLAEREHATAALPFESASEAVDALLGLLEHLGLGRWALETPALGTLHALDGVVIPLVTPFDSRLLAIRSERRSAEAMDDRAVDAAMAVARLIATVLAAEAQTKQISEQAALAERESTTDELTGIANARAWWRVLSRQADECDRAGVSALVAVVDLNDLKRVNDLHGHLAGDLLIRTAATALRGAIRPIDVLARVGGDEFGILVVGAGAADRADLVVRICDELRTAGVSASVGVEVYEPGDQINDVYHRADLEMYSVKRARLTI